MPLDLALTLIDARARTLSRRAKPAAAAAPADDGGKRVVIHGDGKQTVHFSGNAALEAMLRPMPLGGR